MNDVHLFKMRCVSYLMKTASLSPLPKPHKNIVTTPNLYDIPDAIEGIDAICVQGTGNNTWGFIEEHIHEDQYEIIFPSLFGSQYGGLHPANTIRVQGMTIVPQNTRHGFNKNHMSEEVGRSRGKWLSVKIDAIRFNYAGSTILSHGGGEHRFVSLDESGKELLIHFRNGGMASPYLAGKHIFSYDPKSMDASEDEPTVMHHIGDIRDYRIAGSPLRRFTGLGFELVEKKK